MAAARSLTPDPPPAENLTPMFESSVLCPLSSVCCYDKPFRAAYI